MSDKLDPLTAPAYAIKEGDGWVAVFNPDTPRQMDMHLCKRFSHNGVVCCVKFSSDGSLLAVGTDNAVILYHLIQDQKVTFSLGGEEEHGRANHARSVAISPDGKFLVAGSEDTLIRIWNIETHAYVQSLIGHRGEVYALAFTPDSRYLLSASGDRTVRVWDATRFQLATDPGRTCHILRPGGIEEESLSKSVFMSLSVDSSSSFVAAGSLDGIIRVWNILASEGEEPVAVINGHGDGVYGVQFLPSYADSEEMTLVSASLDRTLKRWRLIADKGQFILEKTLTGHKDCVLATSALQVGREQRVASASRDGTVRLWDLRTGMPYFMIQGHTNAVTSVDLCSNGSLLVSGSGDRQVRIWRYILQ